MEEREARLIEDIRAVFPTVRGPLDAVRPFPGDPERAELQRVLSCLPWSDLRFADLIREFKGCAADIPLMLNPSGLKYYLPAFLVMMITEDGPDLDILEETVFGIFTGRLSEGTTPEVVDLLSTPEKSIVLETLIYVAETWSYRGKQNDLAKLNAILSPE